MAGTIVINPVTRISGFLEIEVRIENNTIVDAKSSGIIYRGFEKMLKGRSPLDAIYFTERICGICSTAHSIASTLALENALEVASDLNDTILRNIIHGCEFVQNHLRHFYQFVIPDYVKSPSLSSTYDSFHNDFRLPEKLNNQIAEDYIESLRYSRAAHEMIAVLGGKAPHNHGIFVGGVTCRIDASKLIKLQSLAASIKSFVNSRMLRDTFIISEYYPEYFKNGGGYENLMSYGAFDFPSKDISYLKAGVMINGIKYDFNPEEITESVYTSWYEMQRDNVPYETPPDTIIGKKNAYSFIKAPRYNGMPMEVGPLARMYLSGIYTNGISTMDRIIARSLETKKVIEIIECLLKMVKLVPPGQRPYSIPNEANGAGLVDTTRGSLGHWVGIREQKIFIYDIISPTTWNASSDDANGTKGTMEMALVGTHINDVSSPVEIGRIIRSFDPCISCAVHAASDSFPDMRINVL